MKDLVFDLIEQEKTRQSEGLELIPSENYVSKNVLKAMGSTLMAFLQFRRPAALQKPAAGPPVPRRDS